MSETHKVISNPSVVCPSDIFNSIIRVEVDYINFDGSMHTGMVEVKATLAEDIRKFFAEAMRIRFPINRVAPASEYRWDDDLLMTENISSGFNYRLIAGTKQTSAHSYGAAIDINPVQNPYIRYTSEGIVVKPEGSVWDPKVPGTLSADHRLVEFFMGLGWEWGGGWSPESGRVDYQHFQKHIIRS